MQENPLSVKTKTKTKILEEVGSQEDRDSIKIAAFGLTASRIHHTGKKGIKPHTLYRNHAPKSPKLLKNHSFPPYKQRTAEKSEQRKR